MNACELTMTVTAIANAIACNISKENLPLAAAIFTQVGDTLATIGAHREWCEDLCESVCQNNCEENEQNNTKQIPQSNYNKQ